MFTMINGPGMESRRTNPDGYQTGAGQIPGLPEDGKARKALDLSSCPCLPAQGGSQSSGGLFLF